MASVRQIMLRSLGGSSCTYSKEKDEQREHFKVKMGGNECFSAEIRLERHDVCRKNSESPNCLSSNWRNESFSRNGEDGALAFGMSDNSNCRKSRFFGIPFKNKLTFSSEAISSKKRHWRVRGSAVEEEIKKEPASNSQTPHSEEIQRSWKSAKEIDDGTEGREPEHGTVARGPILFGVEMSADTTAVAVVYFVQGVLGLARLAVTFFLKDELGLDPAETAFLSGISAAPWLIKPLYGFISDGLPLFGYRRRSYLVLCGLLGAASWGSLSAFVNGKYEAVALILLSSLSVAFSDVVVDSMVVERARGESQGTAGSLQSLCWGSSAIGGIVSAYFSGSLVEAYGSRFVFGLTAILPLLTSAVGAFIQEEKIDHSPALDLVQKSTVEIDQSESLRNVEKENLKAQGNGYNGVISDGAFGTKENNLVETIRVQMTYLWETIREPTIFLPTLFIFLWQATPVSDTAVFYFTTNELGFGPEFLGRVKLVTSVASLAGVGAYNAFLKDVPLKKIFFWTTVLGAVLGSTQLLLVTGVNRTLGISDQFFAIGDSLILTVLGQISFMPVLVLAARLCPPGVEATLFSTLMSISNGGGVIAGLLGASLTKALGVTSTEFGSLPLLLILCNTSSLLPLLLIDFLPSEEELNKAVDEAEEKIDARKRRE